MFSSNNLQSSPKHDSLISESTNSRTLTTTSLKGPQYLLQPERARKIEETYESIKFKIQFGEDLGIEAPQQTIHVFTDHNI